MDQKKTNLTNAVVTTKLHDLLDEAIAESARHGWHGRIELTIQVEEGTLQGNSAQVEVTQKRKLRLKQ